MLAQTFSFPFNSIHASHGTFYMRAVFTVTTGSWCTEATVATSAVFRLRFGDDFTCVHIDCWTRIAGSNDVPATFHAKATVFVGYYITW